MYEDFTNFVMKAQFAFVDYDLRRFTVYADMPEFLIAAGQLPKI
jgi:hypothetical protein